MIIGIQLVGIFFCIVMMYLTFLFYKQDNYGKGLFILWLGIWMGALLIIMFPSIIYGIMDSLKIKRTADFFILGGLMGFSVIIFYIFKTVNQLKKQMEKLIRELAIKFPKEKED